MEGRGGLGVAMGVGGVFVSTALRPKGLFRPTHLQPPVVKQLLEHRIGQQAQFLRPHLQGHMAIAQVISRLQQLQGAPGPHHQERFGRRLHLHESHPILLGEPFPRLQGRPPGELQEQILAAAASPMPPQAGAVLGAEGQAQGGVGTLGWGGHAKTPVEHQGW